MHSLLKGILNPEPHETQVLFAVNHKPFIDTRHKNVEISKVYTGIIQDLRYLLSRMSFPEHRTYLLTSFENESKLSGTLFEFTCIMCTLTLSVNDYCYRIELDTDTEIVKVIGDYNYRKMLRAVYRNTMFENTVYDIEDSLYIDCNLANHYRYFKNQLKERRDTDTLIMVEDAILE